MNRFTFTHDQAVDLITRELIAHPELGAQLILDQPRAQPFVTGSYKSVWQTTAGDFEFYYYPEHDTTGFDWWIIDSVIRGGAVVQQGTTWQQLQDSVAWAIGVFSEAIPQPE